MSPGGDVFFSIEYVGTGKGLDSLMKTNDEWLAEYKIKKVTPTTEAGNISGVANTHFELDTTDANGKTLIDHFLIPAGSSLAMLTLWGSVEERNKHQAEIMSIINSLTKTP